MEIRNKRLSDDEFFKERKEVLAEWPTGQEVDLDEAIEYHKSLPQNKVYAHKIEEANRKGTTYVHSGMGHTTLEQEIELLTYVQDNGPADLLEMSVDTFTRIHNFKEAERGIKESERTGTPVLNGFPPVNYGVAGVRKLIDSLNVPVKSAYASPDSRIIHEIMFAGGVTGNSGGMLSFWNYNSNVSAEKALRNFQYVWRLLGYYTEKGAIISDVAYGGASVLSPPSIGIALNLTQSLVMAEQGIKHLRIYIPVEGNLVQDVASARTYRKLAREYLDRFGYKDVVTFTETSSQLVTHPPDFVPNYAVIGLNCLTARFCDAQELYIKTISEARAIAIKEETAASYRCANTMINLLQDQKLELDSKAVEEEAEITEREARAIIARVLELGDGDVAVGIVRSVETGTLDCAFASPTSAACKIMGVRDSQAAVRWFDHGNLPIPRDALEFHKQKIAERGEKRGKAVDYQVVIGDLCSGREGRLMLPFQ